MKISFTTLACPDWTLRQMLDAARGYGYDGIDFRGYRRELAIYKLPEFSDNADETVEQIKAAGIELSGFSSSAKMFQPDTGARKDAVAEVAAYAKLCETFGTKYIRVFGGAIGETSRDDAVAIAVDVLEEMAAAAAPAEIAVESHDEWIESALLARVMKRVQAGNVGVLWDLHHPYRMKGESPRETYENIGRYVNYTHVKDSRPDPDAKAGHTYTLGGEGDVPLAEMFSLLKSGGYDGWITLEWEKQWHPEIAEPDVALPQYAEYLRSLL